MLSNSLIKCYTYLQFKKIPINELYWIVGEKKKLDD